VESAFLNAKLKSKMYIKIPEVMVALEFVTEKEREKYAI
jgi:hypothetical protein